MHPLVKIPTQLDSEEVKYLQFSRAYFVGVGIGDEPKNIESSMSSRLLGTATLIPLVVTGSEGEVVKTVPTLLGPSTTMSEELSPGALSMS